MKRPLHTLMSIPVLWLAVGLQAPAVQAGTTVDDAEAGTLQFMREEEKLARDVYRTLFASWGKQIFSNISESEQTHTDTVASFIDKYGLEDPVTDDGTGVFVNPVLQGLYTDLVQQGELSLIEALTVGAFIEETDMLDLQHAIDETDNADIANAYDNLLRGSRNHLRAFVDAIEQLGVVYESQVLPQAEVDEIVNSPVERG